MSLIRYTPALFMATALVSAPHALAQTPPAQPQDHNMGMAQVMGADRPLNQPANAEFAFKANVSGTFEILSSRLALSRSQNPDVRAYAEKMIADHTKAGTELNTAIRSEGLEAHPALLDRKHADLFDRLKDASNDDFDNMYVDIQTSAHDEATTLFRDYSENGPAGALKDFATKTLPTLNAHHENIKAIDKRN